ncbi:Protein kinase-like domain [Phytophthora cactorum]|nr:Protein kinase-like domain [Phytophthora cactorum]
MKSSECTTDFMAARVLTESVDKETLESHSCDSNRHRWYSSNDNNPSVGAVIETIAGCFIVLAVVVFCRQQGKKVQTPVRLPLTIAILQSDDNVHTEEIPSDRSSLWNDEVIIAKRIPRDKIKIKKIISQRSKMLVPATRGSLQQINEFLAEGRMVASMEHPRIVSFIGVAWDSLSDICVVLELMDGDVA